MSFPLVFSKLTTIIFRKSLYVVDILTLSYHLPYFSCLTEDKEIDLTPITVPEEIEEPEKVFETMLTLVLRGRLIGEKDYNIAITPEIGWFLLYFEKKNMHVLYSNPESLKFFEQLEKFKIPYTPIMMFKPNFVDLDLLTKLSDDILIELCERKTDKLIPTYNLLRKVMNRKCFNGIAYWYFRYNGCSLDNINEQKEFANDEIDKKIIEHLETLLSRRYSEFTGADTISSRDLYFSFRRNINE